MNGGIINSNSRDTAIVTGKAYIGKLGFALLGFSFLLWALFIAAQLVGSFVTLPQNSPLYLIFIFSSMGSTSLGIILLNMELHKMITHGRFLIRLSSLIFAVINLIGLFLVYYFLHGAGGGINLSGTEPTVFYIYILAEAALFIVFVFVYNSCLIPFTEGIRKILVAVADALAGGYLVLVLVQSYLSNLQHLQNKIPNSGVLTSPIGYAAYSIQLANPVFGLPGLSLVQTFHYMNHFWMDALLIAANTLFAYLFFSIVFRFDKKIS